MHFLVVERFRDGDARPVYERFQAQGRLAPDGLRYLTSWVSTDLTTCWQIMACDDRSLLEEWIARWTDLVDFEVREVLTSSEAKERVLGGSS